MTSSDLPLSGSKLVEAPIFADARGKFSRIYCRESLRALGMEEEAAQVNYSFTAENGTVRGLHFQYPPRAEWKVVRCVAGAVFDVMADLRKSSATFLGTHAVELTAENGRAVLIPPGVAHGFQTLTDSVELIYVHTQPYAPELEGGARFDDPLLKIRWPLTVRNVSERDLSFQSLTSSSGLDL